jgi:GAF domain-containing protein
VAANRLVRILGLLAESGTPIRTGRLCTVAAEVTGVDGAGIMLLSGDVPEASLCTTNTTSTLIEDLQYTLGEGPCVDAHRDGIVTVEPDLADPSVARWPAFAPPALAGGARAVFGFPIRVGAVRLGALNLYRGRPGALSDDQHADALVMAAVAARAILASQNEARAGQLAVDLETDANVHPVVHQAAGMVSIQLDVSVGEALIRLRARAFQTDRLVTDVGADVVARRLRFDTLSDE